MSGHAAIVESPAAPTPPSSATVLWRTEDDTAAFAQALARQPQLRNAYIELHGELGAGKTSFVRHLLRALGVQGRIKSPTYAVLEPHSGADQLSISHFDFYRFSDPREWEDAGFRDLFAAPGLKLAEWPEHAAAVLPTPDLSLHIQALSDERRQVRINAPSASGAHMLNALLQEMNP